MALLPNSSHPLASGVGEEWGHDQYPDFPFDFKVFDHDPRLASYRSLVPTHLTLEDVRPKVVSLLTDFGGYAWVTLGREGDFDKAKWEAWKKDPRSNDGHFSLLDWHTTFASALSDGLYQSHPRTKALEEEQFWNETFPFYETLSQEEKAIGATIAATWNPVFYGDWTGGRGELGIQRDGLQGREAIAVEAVMRVAEAAGYPVRFENDDDNALDD
jgi:hypothetical protein